MVLAYTVDVWTLTAIGAGWIFALLAIGILMLVFMTTPAGVFLKASMKKLPIISPVFRDGSSDFLIGNKSVPGTVDVKGMGPVKVVEKTMTRDRKSNVPIYHMFGEFATTMSMEYPAIIQQMREAGMTINTFEDYERAIKILTDPVEEAKVRDGIKAAEDKQKFTERVAEAKEKFKGSALKIPAYTSIPLHMLGSMFPWNLSPGYLEQYAEAKLLAFKRKHKLDQQMLIYGGITIFILVLAAVVAFKFLTNDHAQAATVVCQYAPQTMQNLTNATGAIINA